MSRFKWAALLAAIVLVALLAVGATSVFAAEQKPAAGKQGKQQQGAGNIDTARKRIDKVIGKLSGTKDKRLAAFKKVQDRLNKAMETLAAKGLDVSKLKFDVEALASKVNAASAKCDEVIAALQNAKAQDTLEKLRAAAKDALGNARELRADIREIRTFAKTVIRPDIQALRQQVRQGTDTASPEPAI